MDILDHTAKDILCQLKDGDISVEAYATQITARVKDQAELNVFIGFDDQKFLDAARTADRQRQKGEKLPPLFGLPLAIKDNIETRDYPTTAGTKALQGKVPTSNAPLVQTLLDQGSLIAGKTNLHELAMGITSHNGVFGAVRNPYDPQKIPGGSSGGSAAAVAARMVPVSLGTDTGGSARIPAALCGVVGFRPSVGRYDSSGTVPVSHTRDTIGSFAHTVEDISLLDSTITGQPSLAALDDLKGVRIGIPRTYFYENLDTDVARQAEKTLDLLKEQEVVLVEADIPNLEELNEAISFPVCLYEFFPDLKNYLKGRDYGITLEQVLSNIGSPDVKGLCASLLGDGAIPEEIYQDAIQKHRPALQKIYADHFSQHNISALLFPTTPLTARPIGQDETVQVNGVELPTFGAYIRNTDPSSNIGIPGISLPVGLSSEGLPIGMELDGPAGADLHLLRLAAALQKIMPALPAPC